MIFFIFLGLLYAFFLKNWVLGVLCPDNCARLLPGRYSRLPAALRASELGGLVVVLHLSKQKEFKVAAFIPEMVHVCCQRTHTDVLFAFNFGDQ